MAAVADLGFANYARLASLPLHVEAYSTERREQEVSSGFRRVTTTVVLTGGGSEGRGEDVTYAAEDHDGFPFGLPLDGDWTLDEFSRVVGGLDLFPAGPPQMEVFRSYRQWAFESAALDLALRQSGQSLGAALGRPFRPVHFVLSTRLDVRPWLKVDPELEFKLDPTPEWDAALVERVAASGRVRVLDFKAFYEGSVVENTPDAAQYAMVAEAFPEAILEDPALEGPARAALDGREGRFSFDAPIHSWTDVELTAVRVFGSHRAALSHLNIKPSRFGSVGALLYCVERALAAGMELYGGGQFELGVGRDQIEALASLFYADGPNDVAPREYHGDAAPGLPRSRLEPLEQDAGFGFVFRR